MNSFRRLFPFLAVAALPFILIFADRTVETSDQSRSSENYDIREDTSEIARTTRAALVARTGADELTAGVVGKRSEKAMSGLRANDPGVRFEVHPFFGTPEITGTVSEFLTARSNRSRPDIVRQFINSNPDMFGLTAESIGNLKLTADYTNPSGNLSFVHFEQQINGVPVFAGEIRAALTPMGELVRVVNGVVPAIDVDKSSDFGDRDRAASVAAGNVDGKAIDAEQIYFPIAAGTVVPAWRVTVDDGRALWYVIVDAENGTLLWRKNLTSHQTQSATYEVYGNTTSMMKTADSPSPFTPGCLSPIGCPQPPAVPRTQFTLIGNELPYQFNNLGWIADGETRTIGNNVEAGIDRDGANGIDPNGWAFGNPNRNFVFAYNPGPGLPPPGDAPVPTTQTYPPSAFQQGSVTHAFYLANRWHDETYRLGFTEQARNFQADNFGRGGLAADSLIVEVQDISATNGANFATPADGTRPRGQMFVWTGPTPDRDGALDSQVLTHELTHGLSNRLHGNAVGLSSNMARGMGEGWSDFYALALLSEPTDDACGTYTVAGYITYLIAPGFEGNYYYGIRRFPTARRGCLGPNGRPHNPVTFRYLNSDCNTLIGTTTSDPPPSSAFPRGPIGVTICDQTHNIGEIWSAALWEVRGFLIEAHGATEGNRRALQYITDGMKLSPLNPTLLQSRDAIIAAAAATDPGDVVHVRRGFALRGMGASASIQNTGTGNNNTVVTEAFDVFPNAVIGSGFAVSDSPGNNNGSFEPGEPVLVTLPLTNTTGQTITGLTVTAVGGGSATYGDIANGQTVTRTIAYTIPIGAVCPGNHSISFNISGSVGTTTESRTIFVGTIFSTATFENMTPVTINATGAASPYPTVINVSGVPTGQKRLTLELTNLTHTFPSDLDLMLVGPGGQKYVFLSDTGSNFAVNGITLTFDDFAPSQPGSALVAGTFRPINSGAGDPFPAPAPAAPYLDAAPAGSATLATAFNLDNAAVNGSWSLYVNDDASPDSGSLAGWKLKIDTFACVVCRACRATGARSDFDGDGRSDISVFRPGEGIWYLNRSTAGFAAVNWGLSGDRIVPGDFDGDGKDDIAIFRPSDDANQPDFYVLRSSDSTYAGFSWGVVGDISVIGDYDGDQRADPAVYRPSNHTFYVRHSFDASVRIFSNIPGGAPLAGDFDGDGKADFASYSVNGWYLAQSIQNFASVGFTQFGAAGDQPVAGDYDGDAKDDFAVFRPTDRTWWIRGSTIGVRTVQFGLSTDQPVPADYDGDGKTDIAVFRNGVWYIDRSTSGMLITQFGLTGDTPTPVGYLP